METNIREAILAAFREKYEKPTSSLETNLANAIDQLLTLSAPNVYGPHGLRPDELIRTLTSAFAQVESAKTITAIHSGTLEKNSPRRTP